MTHQDVIDLLKNHIKENYGTQRKYAIDNGIPPQLVCAVLKGRKPPTSSMLKDINITKRAEIVRTIIYTQA